MVYTGAGGSVSLPFDPLPQCAPIVAYMHRDPDRKKNTTVLKLVPTMLSLVLLLFTGTAATLQNGRADGYPPARIPILYEAYYPEKRELSPQATLQEIRKLRQLTSQLLQQEEQLSELAAAAAEAAPESVLEPRGQILEYVLSAPAAARRGRGPAAADNADSVVLADAAALGDDVRVASLTVSDTGPRHKTRHHHGQHDWLLHRLGPNSGGGGGGAR